MDGPSAHLRWRELASHDQQHTPYPERWRVTRAVTLAIEFEHVRAMINGPIRVASGYRTPAWNRAIKGARHSQHIEGRALDLEPPEWCTIALLYAVVYQRAKESESAINGIARYPTFVHFDIRPSVRLIVWQGMRAWSELKGVNT